MPYARLLPSGNYQGGYRGVDGRQRSAGTYPTEAEALAAAVRAANGHPVTDPAEPVTFTAEQVAALLAMLR